MRTFYFIFLFLNISIVWSQTPMKPFFMDSISVMADHYIGKDNLKNDYFLFKNALKKKNALQNYQYQNLSLGSVGKVCITNPLQIVVFYENFNSLILLDNQLNETQQIDGNTFETPIKMEAFGLASQNQLWLYDGFLQKISLYNFKSNIHKIISTPIPNKIKNYSSDYNYFYWVDETNTLYSISLFGKIKKMGKIPEYDSIQIIDASKIIYIKDGNLFYFNLDIASQIKIDLIEKSFDNFFYSNGILSIFTHSQIINYKIDLP